MKWPSFTHFKLKRLKFAVSACFISENVPINLSNYQKFWRDVLRTEPKYGVQFVILWMFHVSFQAFFAILKFCNSQIFQVLSLYYVYL